MQLRPYQLENLNAVRAHIKAGRRSVLWQLPTGGGKTIGAAFMLKTAAERGHRAWFVCHRRELVQQSHRAFLGADVPHGIIAAGFDNNAAPVQIVSVQTVVRRLERVQPPDLIVWDECHHLAAGSWSAIYEQFGAAKHIGLSATPERHDGRGLGKYFEAMVCGPSVRELTAAGYLSPYVLYGPSAPDLAGVHMRGGDYARNELEAVMAKPTVTGNAVDHYRKFAPGLRAIMFTVSIQASQREVAALNAAGIAAEHVDSHTDDRVRDAAMERLRTGETRVLSNVDLFGEGVDVPAIECVIDRAPTMSLLLYLQRRGRGLRPSPGKSRCVFIDAAGNWQRHGFPDDDRAWTLDGNAHRSSKSEPDAPPIRQCPACYAMSPAAAAVCRECRAPFPVQAREVEHVEGELAEVDAATLRREARREQGRADSLEALEVIARQRGYKPGWARRVYAARMAKREVMA